MEPMSTTHASPRTYSAAIATGRVEEITLEEFTALLAEDKAVTLLRPRCQAVHTFYGRVSVFASGLAYFWGECCNPRTGYSDSVAYNVNGHRRPVFDFYNRGRLVQVTERPR
jgi:hypothetical protein